MNVLRHDREVGDAISVKRHPYRLSPEKRWLMCKEVDHMLKYGIPEPGTRSWSSPCLLVKSDKTPCFCTDFQKVHSVIKPDLPD